jgi:hypothetical protein
VKKKKKYEMATLHYLWQSGAYRDRNRGDLRIMPIAGNRNALFKRDSK